MGIVEMARMDMVCVENAELAAQTGAADALFELGLMYSTGRDVEPDLVTAHKWFNLAALRGNKAALEYRKELAFEMSQFDVAEAQKSARECRPVMDTLVPGFKIGEFRKVLSLPFIWPHPRVGCHIGN